MLELEKWSREVVNSCLGMFNKKMQMSLCHLIAFLSSILEAVTHSQMTAMNRGNSSAQEHDGITLAAGRVATDLMFWPLDTQAFELIAFNSAGHVA